MKRPIGIELIGECLTVLRETLLAVNPNEGCALLLGNLKKSTSLPAEYILQLQMIWPCCNVWGSEIINFLESPEEPNSVLQKDNSKKNRFAIDPREQLQAQHWAREHNWEVVGSAHSHPTGDPIPSSIDRNLNFSPGLMLIIGQFGEVRAWWMGGDETFPPIEVAIWKT
ncbi:M67 family metallopeptidase [Prochlorococcus sp. MIT 1307]|uniref:M67 family metallopeptidase n=1 Tax=Prochlorococcus sp. MIT 1307 TaxID=3096219 RepID=UPI002A748A3D|nr:M67 family metallopeptidase [Prochlorococcus sp. MIT 1307]